MPRVRLCLLALLLSCATARADDKIRVACVGDSITYGAGVAKRAENCYPAVLGRLLGDKYEVRNFGVNGATLLSKGDLPYVKQKAFEEAKAFKPNLVVINLGANDTKPQNWKFEEEYVGDYQKLIEAFTALESKPQVYVCTPVPAYPGNFGISNERLEKGVKPKVEQLAKDGKLKLIDLYAALSEKANLFPDKIHPNAEGAKLIAEAVHKALGAK